MELQEFITSVLAQVATGVANARPIVQEAIQEARAMRIRQRLYEGPPKGWEPRYGG